MGGEAGRRVLRCFQIQTSGDTLLRVLRRTPLVPTASVRVLGIDDWALKKGRDYGTLMVDLERHQVVDVLLERTASVVRDWLQNQPRVQLITRDRSTEYANGIQARTAGVGGRRPLAFATEPAPDAAALADQCASSARRAAHRSRSPCAAYVPTGRFSAYPNRRSCPLGTPAAARSALCHHPTPAPGRSQHWADRSPTAPASANRS